LSRDVARHGATLKTLFAWTDLKEVHVVLLRDAGDLADLGLLPRATVDEVGRDGDRQLGVQAAAVEPAEGDLNECKLTAAAYDKVFFLLPESLGSYIPQ
jgi:hypothetical protein